MSPELRSHEIRIGMSVYWVRTIGPNRDGEFDWYVTSCALSGTGSTREGAALLARAALRRYDAERLVAR